MTVFIVLPMMLVAYFAFTDKSGSFTMENILSVGQYSNVFLRSIWLGAVATAISLVREVVFGVGFALLLPLWFGLDGVLYSMPVSDVLTFVICVAVIAYTYRELNSNGAPKLCGA